MTIDGVGARTHLGEVAFRVAFFDIGGVLEHTPATGWQGRWESELALAPGELDVRLQHVWEHGSVGAISEQEAEQAIRHALGLDPEQLRRLMNDAWAEYLGEPNTELIRYVASLRSRVQTAIISNSFVGARAREQARYDFDALCELIVYSHEEGVAKPDRQIFDIACERLSISPREALFVDDVEANVHAARELGMHAILFRDTQQTIAALDAQLS